jgi:peroxin-5
MSGLVLGSDMFPQDWLLWNRVGATLANSGHADQALEYYSQALQMNPMYIRARYNMGIALANLKVLPSSTFCAGSDIDVTQRYGDAAEYFFDALLMQESDATRDAQGVEDRQGLTSGALWDSLKSACNRMQRSDLSSMCEKRDLEGSSQFVH